MGARLSHTRRRPPSVCRRHHPPNTQIAWEDRLSQHRYRGGGASPRGQTTRGDPLVPFSLSRSPAGWAVYRDRPYRWGAVTRRWVDLGLQTAAKIHSAGRYAA
jgi:hypothetical protein